MSYTTKDRADLAVLTLCIVTLIVMPLLMYFDLTDPVKAAEQKQRDYNNNYPCINGVRYIRASSGITPMIDPATMQPQLCGAEKAP